MSSDKISVRNTLNGEVTVVSRRLLNNPRFAEVLVPVEDDAKSYVPGLYKPKTAEEYLASKPAGRRAKKSETDAPIESNEKDED